MNRGERLTGSIHFKVNDARSYDLTLDLEVDRGGGGAECDRDLLKRRATYALQQQCFKQVTPCFTSKEHADSNTF